MGLNTYCFVNKKTYETLKKAGKVNFPIHKFLETAKSKEDALKQFAKDTIMSFDDAKKMYHCFIYKPNKTHKI